MTTWKLDLDDATMKMLQDFQDERDALQARIEELEAVIKSHGIPVKTYAGGEAHYCTKVKIERVAK